MKTVSSLSPAELQAVLSCGQCQLIDVREAVEHAEERVLGAKLIPLGELERRVAEIDKSQPIYVMCRGGVRGAQAAEKLAALGCPQVKNLEGGILAWKASGLSVERSARRGLPLMQQVQLTIGLCVATGSVLALTQDKRFAFIPLFFGSGLILAGSTGWCGLALLMAKMPWNKVSCEMKGNACCN
jgi:rhodanese-related sulfurtransferase